jgi:hypothetical protein
MSERDPFGYDHAPPGTFNDPSRPAVYSPAELDFRDLHTNPNRREEYARWCAEARARWAASHAAPATTKEMKCR